MSVDPESPTSVVEWGDPPPPAKTGRAGRAFDWVPVVAALRTRPGRWARVRISLTDNAARQLAASITRRDRGKYRKAFAVGRFEATSRGDRVWVRYVGEAGQHG